MKSQILSEVNIPYKRQQKRKHPSYPQIPETVGILKKLQYFERGTAHILAGWSPKISEIGIKLILGQHLSFDMTLAHRLQNRIYALDPNEQCSNQICESWRDLMISIDKSKTSLNLLISLYLVIKQKMIDIGQDFLDRADPIGDYETIQVIESLNATNRKEVTWAKYTIGHTLKQKRIKSFLGRISKYWKTLEEGKKLLPGDAIWKPVDRVPQVARPKHFKRGSLGAIRRLPSDPIHNRADIGIFLHGFLNEEITTLELVCRNFYEHPDMPSDFHYDMARHAGDEARHAMMVARCAESYGVTYGDYPIYISSYEGQYQFLPCEVGSKKELLWRILLRQTFHEGLALDSLSFEIRKRSLAKQPELERLFTHLLTDELFHVQSGLKWSRYLCDGDVSKATLERQIAHDYFIGKVKQTRAEFVAMNPLIAMQEVDRLEKIKKKVEKNPLPFKRTLNVVARKKAGFTDEEIEQIVSWGYVHKA